MLAKNSVFLCYQRRMLANVCEFGGSLEFAMVRKELQTFANVRKQFLRSQRNFEHVQNFFANCGKYIFANFSQRVLSVRKHSQTFATFVNAGCKWFANVLFLSPMLLTTWSFRIISQKFAKGLLTFANDRGEPWFSPIFVRKLFANVYNSLRTLAKK